jgi:hypothetical protein
LPSFVREKPPTAKSWLVSAPAKKGRSGVSAVEIRARGAERVALEVEGGDVDVIGKPGREAAEQVLAPHAIMLAQAAQLGDGDEQLARAFENAVLLHVDERREPERFGVQLGFPGMVTVHLVIDLDGRHRHQGNRHKEE